MHNAGCGLGGIKARLGFIPRSALRVARCAFGLDLALDNAELGVAIDIEKEVIIGDDALDDGAQDIGTEQAEFFAVDNGMDALLESLHGAQGAQGTAQQNEDSVSALGRGHLLNMLQGQVLLDRVAGKEFLDENNLILDTPVTDDKIVMIAGGMDFVADLGQNVPR